jgi:hypothetical protein
MSQFVPHPPRQAFRIGRSRRRALYVAFALLLLTGVAWLALEWAQPDPDLLAPGQAWSMKIHGAAALLSVFLVGTIWSSHIRHAWMRRRNLVAGTLFGAAVGLLTLTGYGLYYFNGETLRAATEWTHWTAGLAIGLIFWLHLSHGRRP